MTLNSALAWYQRKIGTYDKQLWEKTVEQRILKIDAFRTRQKEETMEKVSFKGLGNVPKKTTRLKTELIDVDLVRGSAFPKAKPQHGPLVATRRGIARVLFLPLYVKWWKQQTNVKIAVLLLVIYTLQLINSIIYFMHPSYHNEFNEVSPVEVLLPGLLMLILGVVHSQVVATVITNGRRPCTTKLKRKRLKRRSVGRNTSRSTVADRSVSCTSFPFAYHNGETVGEDNRTATPAFANSTQNPVPGDDAKDNSLEKDKYAEVKQQYHIVFKGEDHSPETDESASLTSESSPRAPRVPTDDKSDMDTRNDSAVQDISSGDVETDPLLSDAEGEPQRNGPVTVQLTATKTIYESSDVPVDNTLTSHVDQTMRPLKSVLKKRSAEVDITKRSPAYRSVGAKATKVKSSLVNGESRRTPLRRRAPQSLCFQSSGYACNSSCESEIDTTSPNTPIKEQTSEVEWGLTTNTECESSYSSNTETEDEEGGMAEDPFGWKQQNNTTSTPSATTCPSSDKVSCTIWEGREVHKVDLSVLDISSAIIQRVDHTFVGTDYLVAGVGFAVVLALLPVALRTHDSFVTIAEDGTMSISMPEPVVDALIGAGLGNTIGVRLVVLAAMFNSFCLSMLFFFLLAVAERTFKQRFLYAKLFCHLTSSRQAKKSELPHYRLNKVRNIKTWLSVRSYLKRHGPQRSVDVIVSAAFILAFVIICFLCFQLMKDSENFGQSLLHWELVIWTLALGVYLLRLMTLGAKINKKYRNPSVLITEQINLYLQMEQKPHKKEGLTLANNVLKLAADLLKELESPFKISGLSANPYLYNITKLVILSAFSAVVKELLGFKLKLYKIKIK